MTDPFRGKILNLVSISMLFLAWVGISWLIPFSKSTISNYSILLADIPPWLAIGALMRNGIHMRYTRIKLLGFVDILRATLLGWGMMGLFWFLPSWLPSLGKNNDYGVKINLPGSPVMLLASLAFFLGYFTQASVKILPVARKLTRVSLTDFFKGESEHSLKNYSKGLMGILFLTIPVQGHDSSAGNSERV